MCALKSASVVASRKSSDDCSRSVPASSKNDALLMGVPVLTCVGETMASRVAASQLRAIGLPELVTGSLDEYEARALALARDARYVAQLRQRLVANRRTTPLFDMARFTRNFEAALLSIGG